MEPTFLPGFKLGASRIAHLAERPGGHSLGFYLDRFIDAPTFSQVDTNLPENAQVQKPRSSRTSKRNPLATIFSGHGSGGDSDEPNSPFSPWTEVTDTSTSSS